MVKSRRRTSSSSESEKNTDSGGARLCTFRQSGRFVISKILSFSRTETVPCFIPVGMTLRNIFTRHPDGVCGEIKIIDPVIKNEIPHGASHQIALEAPAPEGIHNCLDAGTVIVGMLILRVCIDHSSYGAGNR
jgi:hypothetical protein